MQLELEALAEYRVRAWEKELAQRALLSRIPAKLPMWQRWLGSGLVQVGRWLTTWGEWLTVRDAVREYTQELPGVNK